MRGRGLRKKSRNLVLFLDVETSYCRTTSVDKESMNVLNINPELKTEKRWMEKDGSQKERKRIADGQKKDELMILIRRLS